MSFETNLVGRRIHINRAEKNDMIEGEIVAVDAQQGAERLYVWVSAPEVGILRYLLGKHTVVLPDDVEDPQAKAYREIPVPVYQDLGKSPTDAAGTMEYATTASDDNDLRINCPPLEFAIPDFRGQIPEAVKPSQWDYAPMGYDWFAQDSLGSVFYRDRPNYDVSGDEWMLNEDYGERCKYMGPWYLIDQDVEHKDSLEARPGSAAEMQLIGEQLSAQASQIADHKPARKTGLRSGLLRYFEDHKGVPTSLHELMDEDLFGTWSKKSVRQALNHLEDAAQIHQAPSGWYWK